MPAHDSVEAIYQGSQERARAKEVHAWLRWEAER
jgi:hypothetical protein